MGDADVLGALADGAVKDFGRRAVGVLLEKMMLDLPDVIDADAVGELDLGERLPIDVVFTARHATAAAFPFHKVSQIS